MDFPHCLDHKFVFFICFTCVRLVNFVHERVGLIQIGFSLLYISFQSLGKTSYSRQKGSINAAPIHFFFSLRAARGMSDKAFKTRNLICADTCAKKVYRFFLAYVIFSLSPFLFLL